MPIEHSPAIESFHARRGLAPTEMYPSNEFVQKLQAQQKENEKKKKYELYAAVAAYDFALAQLINDTYRAAVQKQERLKAEESRDSKTSNKSPMQHYQEQDNSAAKQQAARLKNEKEKAEQMARLETQLKQSEELMEKVDMRLIDAIDQLRVLAEEEAKDDELEVQLTEKLEVLASLVAPKPTANNPAPKIDPDTYGNPISDPVAIKTFGVIENVSVEQREQAQKEIQQQKEEIEIRREMRAPKKQVAVKTARATAQEGQKAAQKHNEIVAEHNKQVAEVPPSVSTAPRPTYRARNTETLDGLLAVLERLENSRGLTLKIKVEPTYQSTFRRLEPENLLSLIQLVPAGQSIKLTRNPEGNFTATTTSFASR